MSKKYLLTMKKMQIIGLSITLFISLANSTVSYGMEPEQQEEGIELLQASFEVLLSTMSYGMKTAQQKEEIECQMCFEKWLPKELQQKIRRLQLMRNAVEFLGLQLPIKLVGHKFVVDSVAIVGDKVMTRNNRSVKIWDINTGQLLQTFVANINGVSSVAIADDKVVTGSFDNSAKISDINTGQLLHTLDGHAGCVNSVAIAGDKVVTGSSDYTVKIWDISTGQLLYTIKGHKKKITSVAIAGDKVVTGSSDVTATIWDINRGQLLRRLVGHRGAFRSVAIAGDKVVTGSGKVAESEDYTAKIWSLSPNLQGTPEDNPLVWIVENATIPQLDFINRACRATIDKQDLMIIALPKKLGKVEENELQAQWDGRIYFTFPEFVRKYLRNRLQIFPTHLNEPDSPCAIQ